VFVLLEVRIETVVVRAQSREMAERTGRRAEKNGGALSMRLTVPVFWKAAEPLVVYDFRSAIRTSLSRFAIPSRQG
jgi:hypothetical protein